MQTILSINLIVSDPKLRSGRPIIAGTSLEVIDIVSAMRREPEPRTPEQVATAYGVTPAQVHAALAYYYEHRAEMDALMARLEALAEEMKANGVGQRPGSLLPR